MRMKPHRLVDMEGSPKGNNLPVAHDDEGDLGLSEGKMRERGGRSSVSSRLCNSLTIRSSIFVLSSSYLFSFLLVISYEGVLSYVQPATIISPRYPTQLKKKRSIQARQDGCFDRANAAQSPCYVDPSRTAHTL